MAVQLNHTIVSARDNVASATFMTEILGLPAADSVRSLHGGRGGQRRVASTSSTRDAVTPQHYAFLISEAEFDEIFGRVQGRGLAYWADPMRNHPGEINRRDGGRGIYFEDPDGHFLEVLTRPYGSGD